MRFRRITQIILSQRVFSESRPLGPVLAPDVIVDFVCGTYTGADPAGGEHKLRFVQAISWMVP